MRVIKAAKNKSLFNRKDIEELSELKSKTISLEEVSKSLSVRPVVTLDGLSLESYYPSCTQRLGVMDTTVIGGAT